MELVVPVELRFGLWGDGVERVDVPVTDSHELAWAAGFFDGEGCTVYGHACLCISLCQAEPTTLVRFSKAIGNPKRVYTKAKSKANKRQQWQWRSSRRVQIQAALTLLWPYLSMPKREQATACFELYRQHTGRRNGWAGRRRPLVRNGSTRGVVVGDAGMEPLFAAEGI